MYNILGKFLLNTKLITFILYTIVILTILSYLIELFLYVSYPTISLEYGNTIDSIFKISFGGIGWFLNIFVAICIRLFVVILILYAFYLSVLTDNFKFVNAYYSKFYTRLILTAVYMVVYLFFTLFLNKSQFYFTYLFYTISNFVILLPLFTFVYTSKYGLMKRRKKQ